MRRHAVWLGAAMMSPSRSGLRNVWRDIRASSNFPCMILAYTLRFETKRLLCVCRVTVVVRCRGKDWPFRPHLSLGKYSGRHVIVIHPSA